VTGTCELEVYRMVSCEPSSNDVLVLSAKPGLDRCDGKETFFKKAYCEAEN